MSLKDNSGWEITCPLIDSVIATLEDMDCAYTHVDIKHAIKQLNRIREINSGLRDWGNNLFDNLDDAKEEIDKLEIQISDLKYEIKLIEKGKWDV